MKELVYDVEGDGLLDDVQNIWCVVVGDPATGEVVSYNDQNNGCPSIEEALDRLCAPDVKAVAHNGLDYDHRALRKVRGRGPTREQTVDTMVLGRLFEPERSGGHSLESYGESMGMKKSEFSEYHRWSQELQDRCVVDVQITMRLWKKQREMIPDWGASVALEHEVAWLILVMRENGVTLNLKKATLVAAECSDELQKIQVELQKAFPPMYVAVSEFTPKKDNKARGYVGGAKFTKIELQEFNPDSGIQIAARFKKKYGWRPRKFTPGGAPAMDEDVLKALDFPEAKLLARYLRVNKMWKQIASPRKKKKDKEVGGGWIHHVNPRTGRVHGYVNPNGAVTGRMTHSNPNCANVDKKDIRLREMWEPMEGWVQLGADGSSLELCMLSHYLSRYDGGAYGKKVTEGKKEDGTDAHTLTIRLLGMTKRDNGKRVIYAMIYGAGDAKLGLIIIEDYVEAGKDRPKASPSALGADAREKLETGITGLGQLKKDIKRAFKRGYIRGLDGRKIWLRSEHSALNSLLQGAGAIVMKKALVLFHYEAIKRFRMKQHSADRDADFGYMLNVHDEVQIECRTREIAEELGKLFVASITRAGQELGVRCPLSGAYDIGMNWGETH